jgi:hypothetical protein
MTEQFEVHQEVISRLGALARALVASANSSSHTGPGRKIVDQRRILGGERVVFGRRRNDGRPFAAQSDCLRPLATRAQHDFRQARTAPKTLS